MSNLEGICSLSDVVWNDRRLHPLTSWGRRGERLSPRPHELGGGDGSDISDYVKFLIIFFFYVNEIENEEKNHRPLPFRFVLFRFFPPAFVLFCWPRKQTSLFFAPIRLCHEVQANLHPSEKAWENNVQFATRNYDASVEGHMQSMVSQLWMFRSFANDVALPSRGAWLTVVEPGESPQRQNRD